MEDDQKWKMAKFKDGQKWKTTKMKDDPNRR